MVHRQGWLDGLVALVTGGASGIGAAVTDRFVAEGARVCVFDRNEDLIPEIVNRHDGAVVGIAGDVRSHSDNSAAVAQAGSAFGRLDCFIGNAGVFDFNRPLSKYHADNLPSAFDELFGINVMGYMLGVGCALPLLKAAPAPSIILTVSNSGLYAGGGGALYVASKHAVVGLVRQLAFELAPEIRVNGVAPGGTITRLSGLESVGTAGRRLNEIDTAAEYIARGLPLGFTPEAEDHAGAYVLLASPENSRAMTGVILPSDGGLEVRGGGSKKSR